MTNQNADASNPTGPENQPSDTSKLDPQLEAHLSNHADTLPCDTLVSNDESSTVLEEDTLQIAKDKKFKTRVEAKSLLLKLTETYPNIFPKAGVARPVALAIGLHKSLLPIAKEWGFDGTIVRSALSWYTKQLRYQRAVAHAEFRTNLDGSQAEAITAEQKEHAHLKIAETENWISEHKPEKANAMAERKKTIIETRQAKQTEAKPTQASNTPQKPAYKKTQPLRSKSRIHPAASKNATQKRVDEYKEEASTNKPAPQSSSVNFKDKINDLMAKFNQH